MMLKYSFLSLNILKRKKLCRFSIIIFVIMFVLSISIMGIGKELNLKYMKLEKENINHSYIMLITDTKDIKDEKISKIEHIKKYYPILIYNNNETKYMYFDNNLIKLEKGNYITKKNEIIIPNSIKKNIGNTIDVIVRNKAIKLNVVGIYDIEHQKFPLTKFLDNLVITSYDFVSENYDNIFGMLIQVDNYKNVSTVIEEIKDIGNYDISITDENVEILDRYSNFYNIINNLSKILIIFTCLLTIIVEFIIIYDNKVNISIMKSFGYSCFKITCLMMYYSIILLSISILISVVILILLKFLLGQFMQLNVLMFVINLMVLLIAEVIVIFISYFFIKRINIIKIIKNQ